MADDIGGVGGPVDWQRCFWALLHGVMKGGSVFGMAFHSSEDMSGWVQSVHDHGDPRVAAQMLHVLEKTRPSWVQNLMG